MPVCQAHLERIFLDGAASRFSGPHRNAKPRLFAAGDSGMRRTPANKTGRS